MAGRQPSEDVDAFLDGLRARAQHATRLGPAGFILAAVAAALAVVGATDRSPSQWIIVGVLAGIGSIAIETRERLLNSISRDEQPTVFGPWVVPTVLGIAGILSSEIWSRTAEGLRWVSFALLALGAIMLLLPERLAPPRSRTRSAPSPEPLDPFAGLEHWRLDETAPPQRRELHEFELVARSQAQAHRLSQRRWRQAHYGIGLPAALLAGAAGATGLSDLKGAWKVVLGLLGLLGSSLSALATALNAGARAQDAGRTQAAYEAIANDAHVERTLFADDETADRVIAIKDRINQLGTDAEAMTTA